MTKINEIWEKFPDEWFGFDDIIFEFDLRKSRNTSPHYDMGIFCE